MQHVVKDVAVSVSGFIEPKKKQTFVDPESDANQDDED